MKFKIKFPSFGKKEDDTPEGVKVISDKKLKAGIKSGKITSYSDQSPSWFECVDISRLITGLIFACLIIFVGSMVTKEISKSIGSTLNSTTSSVNSTIGTSVPQVANALNFITPIFWVAILLVPAYWIWRIFSSTGDVGL